VDSGDSIRTAVAEASRGPFESNVEAKEVLYIPAVRLGSVDGLETTVVSYTTDIPAFNGAWGKPFLLGPGSIHFAHTDEERIPKAELLESIGIYQQLVRQLLQQ
jgi:acetylornithine deacetylase